MLKKLIGATVLIGLAGALIEESQARRAEEERRRNTPFIFPPYLPEYEFRKLVERIARKTARKRNIRISFDGPIIYGTVDSQSGLSEWSFKLDFNDYGILSGKYWLTTDNSDSSIPETIAERIQEALGDYDDNYSSKPSSYYSIESNDTDDVATFNPLSNTNNASSSPNNERSASAGDVIIAIIIVALILYFGLA